MEFLKTNALINSLPCVNIKIKAIGLIIQKLLIKKDETMIITNKKNI